MKKGKMSRLIVMAPGKPRLIVDPEAQRLADRVELAVLTFLAARAEERRRPRIIH